ncbi:hypothetical protein ACIRBX_02860 [Kitasatospora sp. NPDC096147]
MPPPEPSASDDRREVERLAHDLVTEASAEQPISYGPAPRPLRRLRR